MATPNARPGWQAGTAASAGAMVDEGLRRHMLRVYNYMGLGLVLTGIVAFLVGTTRRRSPTNKPMLEDFPLAHRQRGR